MKLDEWFKLNRAVGWFEVEVCVYNEHSWNSNFLFSKFLNKSTDVEELLNSISDEMKNREIDHVEFYSNGESDSVVAAVSLKQKEE